MDLKKSIATLEALASGCSPKTGEVIYNNVLHDPEIIEALKFAAKKLKTSKPASKESRENKPWKKIDFFKKKTFNNLSPEAVQQLKEKAAQLGVTKTENLTDAIINTREKHYRSHEPWSEEERILLQKAIQHTNDLKLLSECFGRTTQAIESYGQKMIYEQEVDTQS